MTISNDGNLTPPDGVDPCHVCGEPVRGNHKYYDKHDSCEQDDKYPDRYEDEEQ